MSKIPEMSSSEFNNRYEGVGKLDKLKETKVRQTKGFLGIGKKTYMDFKDSELDEQTHSVRMKTVASLLNKELKDTTFPAENKKIIAKMAHNLKPQDKAFKRREEFYTEAEKYMGEEEEVPEKHVSKEDSLSSIESKEQPRTLLEKKEILKSQSSSEQEGWVTSGTESEEEAEPEVIQEDRAIILVKKEPKIETKKREEKPKELTITDKVWSVISSFFRKESPEKILKQNIGVMSQKMQVPKTSKTKKAIDATPYQKTSFEKVFQNSDRVKSQMEQMLPTEENERKAAVDQINQNLEKINKNNINLSDLTPREMWILADLMQNDEVNSKNLIIQGNKIVKVNGIEVGKTPELRDLQENVLNLSKQVFSQEMHSKLLPEYKEDLEKLIQFLPELMKKLPKKEDGSPRKIIYSNLMAESIKQISYKPALINDYIFLPHLKDPELCLMRTKGAK